MKISLTNPSSVAIIGGLLALPFAIICTLLVFGIEPPLGPLEPLLTVDVDQPNVIGSAIVFGAWLLSLVAFIVSLAPLVRLARAGKSITTNPINLVLAVVILFFIILFLGGIIVDQYPCWIGVPNCD